MYCIFARFCFVPVCFLLINFIVKIYIIVCKSDKNVAFTLTFAYIRVTNENVTILDRKRPLFLSETTS